MGSLCSLPEVEPHTLDPLETYIFTVYGQATDLTLSIFKQRAFEVGRNPDLHRVLYIEPGFLEGGIGRRLYLQALRR